MTNNNEYNGQDVSQIRTQLTEEAVEEFDALLDQQDDIGTALENYDGEHYEEIAEAVQYNGKASGTGGLTIDSHGAPEYWKDIQALDRAKESLSAPDPREFMP